MSESATTAIPDKLKELGVSFEIVPTPTANYVNCVRLGNQLHLAGHNPTRLDGSGLVCGKLGRDLSIEEGYEAARLCAISLLRTIHNELGGDWSQFRRIVKVVGFVNCTPDFDQHPAVINGASDLFGQIFGSKHARSAVGMCSLPFGMATEVECIVEVSPDSS